MIFDRGSGVGWFEIAEIWLYLGLAISGLWVFVVHCWTAENPFVDLRMFADRNFALGPVLHLHDRHHDRSRASRCCRRCCRT